MVEACRPARSPAQRRPEITPGYDRRRPQGGQLGVVPRSTKAGDYPRLRPAEPMSTPSASRVAQRRPEITPGYDLLQPCFHDFDLLRSTKAGDYPRLRRATRGGRRARRIGPLNEGRRLPPATTANPLNEGRRLPPATAPRRRQVSGRKRLRSHPLALRVPRYGPDSTQLMAISGSKHAVSGCDRCRPSGSPEVRRSLR